MVAFYLTREFFLLISTRVHVNLDLQRLVLIFQLFKSVLNLCCPNISDNLPLQDENRHSEKKGSDVF